MGILDSDGKLLVLCTSLYNMYLIKHYYNDKYHG